MPQKKRLGSATVFEVGPRDGLQSEKTFFNIEERVAMVEGLLASGFKDIEVGSFVREDRIPQLAKTAELCKKLRSKYPQAAKAKARFWAFVPNEKGLEMAQESQVDGVSLFTSVSNTFAQKNVNQSSADLLKQAAKLLDTSKKAKLKHRVYVSTIHYCPFEGEISDSALLKTVLDLNAAGCQEIVLSDTTGHSTPTLIARSLEKILKRVDVEKITLHLHDTRGLALTNIHVARSFGVSRFDSSFGGLGGCPYAPGAAGNLASEDLIHYLMTEGGLKDKISLERLTEVSGAIESKLGRKLTSKVYQAIRGSRGLS